MARASVTTQDIVRTGLTPVLTAPTTGAGNGDVIDTGRVFLYVVAGATAVQVTVESTVTVDDLNLEDLVVSVGANATKMIGPFNTNTFGRPATDGVDKGRAYVSYDNATTVTRAVVSL